jgi:hypothetical protein
MRIFLFFVVLFLLNISCKPEVKKQQFDTTKETKKVESDTAYLVAKTKAHNWISNLKFDLDYIQKKKLGDKKFLAEYLGFYWKLFKSEKDKLAKEQILKQVQPYYNFTLKDEYHNMQDIDDKLFKKNSMSYLRVMWLLDELGFDISKYRQEVDRIKPRLDLHLKIRGNWQKEVFKEYYSFFDMKMPKTLQMTKINNGVIAKQLAFEKYDRNKAYNFTHFVFAAFEYGNKTTQSRFNTSDIAYIKEILPKFTYHYRMVKPNIDLLGEFVTCMVFMGFTDTVEFQKSYNYLLLHQNDNGSWGSYEKARAKIGNDIDFRAYLHTTLVVLEALIEYNEGDFTGSVSKR